VESVRPHPDDPWASTCVGAKLAGFAKEVDASLRPGHTATAIRKVPGASDLLFKPVKDRIEFDQILPPFGMHPVIRHSALRRIF
jgi:hypothetical protein